MDTSQIDKKNFMAEENKIKCREFLENIKNSKNLDFY